MPTVRRLVADRLPLAALMYDAVRDVRAMRRLHMLPTRYGFELAGSATQVTPEFESDEIAFVQKFLHEAEAFIDIGANIGLYSCLSAKAGVRTVAVEPLPSNLQLLYANLKHNAFDQVTVLPVAIGAAPGMLTLYGAATGASLVYGWAGATRGRTVSVLPLDAVTAGLQLLGRQLLVKVDVEGAEAGVLAGAQATLAAEPAPVWLLELAFHEHHPGGRNPHFLEVFDTFLSQGYTAHLPGDDREVRREDVVAWIRHGERGYGGYNYVFRKNS
jgi:FkbM family methyltransferase